MPAQRNARSTPAEISLTHLKSCLVNLPATLESLLVNLNTVSSRFHPCASCAALAIELWLTLFR